MTKESHAGKDYSSLLVCRRLCSFMNVNLNLRLSPDHQEAVTERVFFFMNLHEIYE